MSGMWSSIGFGGMDTEVCTHIYACSKHCEVVGRARGGGSNSPALPVKHAK